MTWNLQGSKATDLDRAAEVINERSPDAVLLQEVRRRQASTLANGFGWRHHWIFKHHFLHPLAPNRAEGAAMLTPHDLAETGSEVISDKTWSWWWTRRIAMWGLIRRDDDACRIINVHLSPHDLRHERLREADRVREIAHRLGSSAPIIVGGDMNDHGERETIDRLPGVEHVVSPPTNPAVAPVNVLDHILLPEDATEVELEVPDGGPQWDGLSDHLPVTVSFTLP